MNEKTKAVIYLIIFVVAIVGISIFLNYRSKTSKQIDANEVSQMPDSRIIEVSEQTFNDEVIKSSKKVLIDFYATWCMPCRIIKPRINEVANEYTEVKFVSIDVDKAPNLSEKYGIHSIPTLVVIEDGKEVNRVVGAVEKDKIIEILGIK